MSDQWKYEDILDLPHPVSSKHPQMSMADRAAQFAPFAALTGHRESIGETARLTEQKVELDESRKKALDEKLQMLREHLDESPEITVTHFQQDQKKPGGAYLKTTGCIKKIDAQEGMIWLKNDTQIRITDIYEIEGELFDSLTLFLP